MNHRKITFVVASCSVLFFLLLISLGSPDQEAEVMIELAATTNSVRGPVTLLRLSNRGQTTVRLDPFCTIYWTNSLGLPTNMFYDHHLGYAILPPGGSELAAVIAPSDAKLWKSSFTYQVRPWIGKRVWNRMRFSMSGNWLPDNSFSGRLGPIITNANLPNETRETGTTNMNDERKGGNPKSGQPIDNP